MKLLLTMSLVFFGYSVLAQTYKRFTPDVSPKFPLYRYDLHQKKLLPYRDSLTTGVQDQIQRLGDGGGIIILPQDRMPCIIPPKATIGLIRNFWISGEPYQGIIPNRTELWRKD